MKRLHKSVMAGLAATIVSCGGGGGAGPTAPVPAATPTPVAVATPTPVPASPTPEPTPPCPTDPCEVPVTRDTKPVRLVLRLFVVEDPAGGVYQYRSNDQDQPIIPVNYKFRLDVSAKDGKNKETTGSGNVIWHWDDNMINVENFENVYHPTLRATKGGVFCPTAELDDIVSNEICLEFRY